MADPLYFTPEGGHHSQDANLPERAVFTAAYAVIPHEVMQDIVTSALPFWTDTRAWILARPLSGFAETFSQYVVEVSPGGGSNTPEPDQKAEAVLFVTSGTPDLTLNGKSYKLTPGAFVFIGPDSDWTLHNKSPQNATFHWFRKRYEPVDGLDAPPSFVSADHETTSVEMPDTDGGWATTRFIDPADMRYDMHVNIVTFKPGCRIPFAETHVMEHGIYILQGTAKYLLNTDWIDVQPGDFLWLRAFCPQACVATGTGPFRYLLYKDVNRHPRLGPVVS